MQEKQNLAKKIKENSNLQKEFKNKRGSLSEVDNEMVKTYETYQSNYPNKFDDEKV